MTSPLSEVLQEQQRREPEPAKLVQSGATWLAEMAKFIELVISTCNDIVV